MTGNGCAGFQDVRATALTQNNLLSTNTDFNMQNLEYSAWDTANCNPCSADGLGRTTHYLEVFADGLVDVEANNGAVAIRITPTS